MKEFRFKLFLAKSERPLTQNLSPSYILSQNSYFYVLGRISSAKIIYRPQTKFGAR